MPRKKTTNKGKASKKTPKSTKASKEVYQAHGKVETTKPSTLDQVWGDDGSGKYTTAEVGEYREQLSEMSRADIQTHATKLGVVPVENRDMLVKRLVKEFERHVASYNRPASPAPTKVSNEALRILSEGR